MKTVHLVVGLGWTVFWVYWLVAAVGVKSGRSGRRGSVGVRFVIAAIVIVLVRVPALRGHETHDPWLAGIGLVMVGAGLSLAVWARRHLGRNWGQPMSQKADPDLVTTGPYRSVRNPIYSGLIVAMIGTAMAVNPGWLLIASVLGAYFVYSAVVEDRFLAGRFPDAYPSYKRSTKMLVPFLF